MGRSIAEGDIEDDEKDVKDVLGELDEVRDEEESTPEAAPEAPPGAAPKAMGGAMGGGMGGGGTGGGMGDAMVGALTANGSKKVQLNIARLEEISDDLKKAYDATLEFKKKIIENITRTIDDVIKNHTSVEEANMYVFKNRLQNLILRSPGSKAEGCIRGNISYSFFLFPAKPPIRVDETVTNVTNLGWKKL